MHPQAVVNMSVSVASDHCITERRHHHLRVGRISAWGFPFAVAKIAVAPRLVNENNYPVNEYPVNNYPVNKL
jgi:hypothetical protein